ncbi:MAG: hypothetical protein FJ026_15735 [Chloroflexi bacterium]|nr:hypothetical protein [Chloroflexota bacterium]
MPHSRSAHHLCCGSPVNCSSRQAKPPKGALVGHRPQRRPESPGARVGSRKHPTSGTDPDRCWHRVRRG